MALDIVVRNADNDLGGGGGIMSSAATSVTTWPDQPPQGDPLQLTLTNSSGLPNPIQYNVVPVTTSSGGTGLNGTDTINQTIRINGVMVAADQSNFEQLTTADIVAYLSCDHQHSGSSTGDSFITPSRILNTLVANSVKAIVLYSQTKNGCLLGNADTLHYRNILSMIDAGDAQQVLGYLNGTDTLTAERVSIVGNASMLDPGAGVGPASAPGGTTNSTVAMSILYSITGLITLLFLAIIATGAVRAHRYPERYGPRSALPGRPRQSRAKGLARAVLETIPIVKFNNQQPAKPDPELELDGATATVSADGRDGRDGDTAQQRDPSAGEGDNNEDQKHHQKHPEATPAVIASSQHAHAEEQQQPASSHHETEPSAEGVSLGCSICTEDFKVGEDMRVLPCNHQFHPNCIDPWLINVSGTCPLCRLDLNRNARPTSSSAANRTSTLPPPLPQEVGVEAETGTGTDDAAGGSSQSQRHRLSRIFDINSLRQASPEERIAVLREMRRNGLNVEAGNGETEAGDVERRQRARLSTRLKETFRIRTRTRSPHPG